MGRPRSAASLNLPEYVYLFRSRYIYRVPGQRQIDLGGSHGEAMRAYAELARPNRVPERASWVREVFRSCRGNAKTRGIEFAITLEDAMQMAARSKGCCELTGIVFDFDPEKTHKRRPWVPSIDRIDSSKGYTPDNCRMVCSAVNFALNEWGEVVLFKVADAFKRRRKVKSF